MKQERPSSDEGFREEAWRAEGWEGLALVRIDGMAGSLRGLGGVEDLRGVNGGWVGGGENIWMK